MIMRGDCLEKLRDIPDEHVQCCVTSPPYWGLRDYGVEGQLGLEETPEFATERLVIVFREVRRVLKSNGTCWINMGDTYNNSGNMHIFKSKGGGKHDDWYDHKYTNQTFKRGFIANLKRKDLVGLPWMLAFALRNDGWYLRQDIIWHKKNPIPESVKDRCTKAHEYIFLLTKNDKYHFDYLAIQEAATWKRGPGNKRRDNRYPGAPQNVHKIGPRETRNKRSVWSITAQPFKGAHFATFPPKLIEPCILAGSAFGDYILDPFCGSGTTGVVAKQHGRKFIGIELNPDYCAIAEKRIAACDKQTELSI